VAINITIDGTRIYPADIGAVASTVKVCEAQERARAGDQRIAELEAENQCLSNKLSMCECEVRSLKDNAAVVEESFRRDIMAQAVRIARLSQENTKIQDEVDKATSWAKNRDRKLIECEAQLGQRIAELEQANKTLGEICVNKSNEIDVLKRYLEEARIAAGLPCRLLEAGRLAGLWKEPTCQSARCGERIEK
jgi:hypothetical protein